MNCPIDNSQLLLSERQGVEIDYCPQCRGVWLDRGELDKLIEKASVQQSPEGHSHNPQGHTASSQHYDQDEDNDTHYRGGTQKRKSMLGELFDF